MAKNKLIEELEELPDVARRQLENKLRAARQQERRALDRVELLEGIIEDFAQIDAMSLGEAKPIREASKEKHHAIAIVHWSDWHVGEVVRKNKTNGLNAFSPAICQRRVDNLVQGSTKLLRLHQREVIVDDCLLVLGGDFITGYLHPELEQTNAYGPAQEVEFAVELLSSAIATFLQNSEIKTLRIVCHRGNHGRTTKKHQYKNDFETSYESLLYFSLRGRLTDERITWIIPEGDIHYTPLLRGQYIRTCHGHQIRYGGGVGGLLVPSNRWVLQQDATQKAILTMFGHFHVRESMSSVAVCGSLKGYDEYAMAFGFKYQPPTQNYFLYDCQRKQFTSSRPIYCED